MLEYQHEMYLNSLKSSLLKHTTELEYQHEMYLNMFVSDVTLLTAS